MLHKTLCKTNVDSKKASEGSAAYHIFGLLLKGCYFWDFYLLEGNRGLLGQQTLQVERNPLEFRSRIM